MKDRDLIERMEALEDLIGWLENKGDLALGEADALPEVEEDEVDEWLQNPELEKVRRWLENK